MTNLTEKLERLVVVAPEWIWYDEDRYMYFVKEWPLSIWVGVSGKHNFPVLNKKEDQALLFGAICEKIEAEGWVWLKQANNIQIIDPRNNNLIIGDSRTDNGLAISLLTALLAALEGRVEKPHNPDQAFHEHLGNFYERMEAEKCL